MEIGDSFLTSKRINVSQLKGDLKDFTFSIRKVKNGFRIWRIK